MAATKQTPKNSSKGNAKDSKGDAKSKQEQPKQEQPKLTTLGFVKGAEVQADEAAMQNAAIGGKRVKCEVNPNDLTPNAPVVALLPIDEVTVDTVAESIKGEGLHYPILIGADNVIIDGHTRVQAAIKIGMKGVPAEKLAIKGASPEGVELALSLNTGRRQLTVSQKRALAHKLLKDYPQWSNGRIARLAGLSGEAVRLYRSELVQSGKLVGAGVRVDAKGREMSTENIGGSSEGKAPTFPAVLLKSPSERMVAPTELTDEQLTAIGAWADILIGIIDGFSKSED